MSACAPQIKIVPPQAGLYPEETNSLGAIGVRIEAKDSQIGIYRPRICEQELFFRNFCGLTPDFIKLVGRRPFLFFVFGLHRAKSQEF